MEVRATSLTFFVMWFALLGAALPSRSRAEGVPRGNASGHEHPISVVEHPISVVTTDDSVRVCSAVELWAQDFVRVTRADGAVEFIPIHRIRVIRGPNETDFTDRVLIEGEKIPSERVRGEPIPPEVVRVPKDYKPPALRGRPLPWDQGFPIIQGGLLGALSDQNPYSDGEEGVAVADFGYLRNVSPKAAVGATFSLVGNQDYLRVGLKPRVRRWITRTTSLDFAVGAFTCVDDTTGDVDHTGVGFTGEASLNFGDFVSITNLVEFSNVDERVNRGPYLDTYVTSGTELAWYLGLKLGGEPGIPASILMGLSAIGLRELGD